MIVTGNRKGGAFIGVLVQSQALGRFLTDRMFPCCQVARVLRGLGKQATSPNFAKEGRVGLPEEYKYPFVCEVGLGQHCRSAFCDHFVLGQFAGLFGYIRIHQLGQGGF